MTQENSTQMSILLYLQNLNEILVEREQEIEPLSCNCCSIRRQTAIAVIEGLPDVANYVD